MNKKLLFLIPIILVSCSKVYYVPERFVKLIPYRKGDKLTFKSSKGIFDTIYVVDVNNFIGPNDPLGIMADEEESYEVLVKNNFSSTFVHKIITLQSKENEGVFFEISFENNDSKFYGKKSFKVEDLYKKERLTKKINGRLYNDIWTFEATEREYEYRDNFIEKLYWSLSHGLVRYEKSNDEYWELEAISN